MPSEGLLPSVMSVLAEDSNCCLMIGWQQQQNSVCLSSILSHFSAQYLDQLVHSQELLVVGTVLALYMAGAGFCVQLDLEGCCSES